jgi:hypothetical protein
VVFAIGRKLTYERFLPWGEHWLLSGFSGGDLDFGYAVEDCEHSGCLSKGHTGKILGSLHNHLYEHI